jgi:hypothetical protein
LEPADGKEERDVAVSQPVPLNRGRRGEGRKKEHRQVGPACQRHREKNEAGVWATAGGRKMGRLG